MTINIGLTFTLHFYNMDRQFIPRHLHSDITMIESRVSNVMVQIGDLMENEKFTMDDAQEMQKLSETLGEIDKRLEKWENDIDEQLEKLRKEEKADDERLEKLRKEEKA